MAVVIPVYRGATTLRPLVTELRLLTSPTDTPHGRRFRVAEIILVHDNGPDDSASAIRDLADDPQVRAVWLARNYGQHAATLAGIASSSATWVVTMDEDGQHVPGDIGLLIDAACEDEVHLVYGRPEGGMPHATWRNATSRCAKAVARVVAGSDLASFTSFRLIHGSRARAVSAYVGQRTFLDSALTWAIDKSSTCATTKRLEGRAGSGYDLGRLLSHFWTLVLSSGNRPLRIVSGLGVLASIAGFLGAGAIAWRRIGGGYDVPGWASVVITQLVIGGLVLFALGVVAEYIGALLRTVQGRPVYIVVDDPGTGPFGNNSGNEA